MAGIIYCGIFCCCVIPSVVVSTYLLANYLDNGFIPAIISTGFLFGKFFLYSFLIGCLINVQYFIFLHTHQSGMKILQLRQESRESMVVDKIESNFKIILKILVNNLLFMVFLYYAGQYFQSWYFNLLLIFYISLIFGYVASFPLGDDDLNNIKIDGYKSDFLKSKIGSKTLGNALIFFAMNTLIYYYYF